jgi:hypothetical protein
MILLDDDRLAVMVMMVVVMMVDDHDRIGIGGSRIGDEQPKRAESGKSKNKFTHKDPPDGRFLANNNSQKQDAFRGEF